MEPARFVTLCFLYCGLLLFTQYAVIYELRLEGGALAHLGVALSIVAAALVRLRYPDEEDANPATWGAFTYGMAALSIILTGTSLAQLVLRRGPPATIRTPFSVTSSLSSALRRMCGFAPMNRATKRSASRNPPPIATTGR